MILVKATPQSEAGQMPNENAIIEMGKFNDELVKAGVLLDGDGLYASSKGARLHFSKEGDVQVIDGPFTETKELISGYWIVQGKSLAEVVERFRSCPPQVGALEVRQMYDPADFEPTVKTDEGRATLAAEEAFRKQQ